MNYTRKWAVVSPCQRYRYELGREWDGGHFGICLWLMLNPSTADGETDDATIRLCRNYSMRWGYRGMLVANLYAWRATHPRDLERAQLDGHDIVGPENDAYLDKLRRSCATIVAAWGSSGPSGDSRRWKVLAQLKRWGAEVNYLQLNHPKRVGLDREPSHPRGLLATLTPTRWDYLPDRGPGAGA